MLTSAICAAKKVKLSKSSFWTSTTKRAISLSFVCVTILSRQCVFYYKYETLILKKRSNRNNNRDSPLTQIWPRQSHLSHSFCWTSSSNTISWWRQKARTVSPNRGVCGDHLTPSIPSAPNPNAQLPLVIKVSCVANPYRSLTQL